MVLGIPVTLVHDGDLMLTTDGGETWSILLRAGVACYRMAVDGAGNGIVACQYAKGLDFPSASIKLFRSRPSTGPVHRRIPLQMDYKAELHPGPAAGNAYQPNQGEPVWQDTSPKITWPTSVPDDFSRNPLAGKGFERRDVSGSDPLPASAKQKLDGAAQLGVGPLGRGDQGMQERQYAIGGWRPRIVVPKVVYGF